MFSSITIHKVFPFSCERIGESEVSFEIVSQPKSFDYIIIYVLCILTILTKKCIKLLKNNLDVKAICH